MKRSPYIPLVQTIPERCRVCYTCVRECPAKAIRIAEGQAQVIPERCIGCGNCVRVCSQKAKTVLGSIDQVRELLAGDVPVAVMLAPSFPAEWSDFDAGELIGMLRALGFAGVHEVAFGADLVAERYRRLLESNDKKHYIATSCPAIVAYVERYHPELVSNLAPVVSPMIATARALRALNDRPVRLVFIGPCIAKKGEALSERLPGEIDAVLTFIELQQMFDDRGITPQSVTPSDFDPPYAGTGALFPISRGLLQAAQIREDLVDGEVVAAEGRTNFPDAIQEFSDGDLDARLLEVLCCNGCIMGAGMASRLPLFSRRGRVSQYVRATLQTRDRQAWQQTMDKLAGLDLTRGYAAEDQRIPVPFKDEISQIMAKMGKFQPEDELNCGACGYDTCYEHAVAIFKGLAETEMCLPYAIEQLRRTVGELAASHEQLASAQEALVQSEKLASMGQLSAGIAHEINNPLGVVLMYAHLLLDNDKLPTDLREDLAMIVEQSDRCKKIVAGLLNFARQNKVVHQPTDIRDLVARCLRGLATPAGITVEVEHTAGDPVAELDRDQISQVLSNIITNAYAAMENGGKLTIRTAGDEHRVRFIIGDTGCGIPPHNLKKIFEPFFTTKTMGKGTGLGLAVTYGIVKMHCGDVSVETNADPSAGPTGTTFTVTLPRQDASGAKIIGD